MTKKKKRYDIEVTMKVYSNCFFSIETMITIKRRVNNIFSFFTYNLFQFKQWPMVTITMFVLVYICICCVNKLYVSSSHILDAFATSNQPSLSLFLFIFNRFWQEKRIERTRKIFKYKLWSRWKKITFIYSLLSAGSDSTHSLYFF